MSDNKLVARLTIATSKSLERFTISAKDETFAVGVPLELDFFANPARRYCDIDVEPVGRL